MAHFNRERIPERVVHAKGGGAFGYFEVTHDITRYTANKVFESIGKKTPIAMRFSTVAGESGSADTARDPRGFAMKFYTEDGIWDLVGNNTPIFFVRDAVLFAHFIHSQKRNPQTHLKDMNMFWDFFSLRPETIHQVMILFSDRGTPDGFRHMHGYGSHTFKFINDNAEIIYCKFHHRTDQGIKNLSAEDAAKLQGTQPDYAIKDLYNAIACAKYPSWTTYIQLMTKDQAAQCTFNPFDVTKVWPHAEYPLQPVGRFVLNRNPENYFAEIEQLAFNPANFIPGIAASPDKMLQGRLFSYGDTHRYRLGANYLQLPVNCPFKVRNYQRDGIATIHNQGGTPNYHPNSFNGPNDDTRARRLSPAYTISGDAYRYDSKDEDNFSQPRVFYRKVLDNEAKNRLVQNLVGSLKQASKEIQSRQVALFGKVDETFGNKIAEGLNLDKTVII